MKNHRAHLRAFLSFWEAPNDAQLDIWVQALAFCDEQSLLERMAGWMRQSSAPPRPWDLIAYRKQSLARIIEEVALQYGLSGEDIIGRSRMNFIIEARGEAVYRARQEGFSYPQIARALKRDHTTILSAYKKAVAQREGNIQKRGAA